MHGIALAILLLLLSQSVTCWIPSPVTVPDNVSANAFSVAKWANTLSEPQYLLGLTG